MKREINFYVLNLKVTRKCLILFFFKFPFDITMKMYDEGNYLITLFSCS